METETPTPEHGAPGLTPEKLRLSESIQAIFAHEGTETITFEEILDRVSHKSFGAMLVILALPSALPLPAPGYSVPFGIALLFLGVQMLRRRAYPWFPARVRERRIKTGDDSRLVKGMVRFLSLFETLVRPRLSFLYLTGAGYRFLGAVVCLCAASMCIPIPLTNTVPAMGVFFIGLGMLEEDGLAGLGGVCVAAAGLALSATVLVLIPYVGLEAADMVKDFIKGLLGSS